MSRRLFIILTLITLALGALVVGFILSEKKDVAVGEGYSSLFPDFFNNENTTPDTETGVLIDDNESSNPSESNDSTSTGGSLPPSSRLQQVVGVPISGYVVFSEDRVAEVEAAPVLEQDTLRVYNFDAYETLTFGDESVEVAHLKEALNRALPENPLEINSVFDIPTRDKVIAFQTMKALSADGIVGSGTKKALTASESTFGTPETLSSNKAIMERVSVVRYMDRANGNIFEKVITYNTTTRLSSRSISDVLETLFNANGTKALVRYVTSLGSVQNALIRLGASGDVIAEPYDQAMTFATLSPDRSQFFYIKKETTGAKGIVHSFDTNTAKQILSTPYASWLPVWSAKSSITVTSLASGLYEGLTYSVAVPSGAQTRVVGDIKGLTTLANPSGTKILVGSVQNLLYNVSLLDVKKNETVFLGITTIPEKCMWNSDTEAYCFVPNSMIPGIYPDLWYKGSVQFTDSLWRIDATTGAATRVVNLASEYDSAIDGVDLSIKENILYFRDRTTMSLWSYKL